MTRGKADEQVTSTSSNGNTLWPLSDHLGTIRDIADYNEGSPAFSITNHRVYDSFGKLESETNSAVDLVFGYTGKQFDDDTGMNYYLNRWYDSRTGKWLSEDPAGFGGGDTNLARYVGNTSTMFVDPLGLEAAFAQDGSANTTSSGILLQDDENDDEGGDGDDEYHDANDVAWWKIDIPPSSGDIVAGPGPPTPALGHDSANVKVICTNNTAWFDSWQIEYSLDLNHKASYHTGIGSWNEVAEELANEPPGSIKVLYLSGHGSFGTGGVATDDDPLDSESLRNSPEAAAVIRSKLAPDAVVVLLGCECGDYYLPLVILSKHLGVPVIANTGGVEGIWGDEKWKIFIW